MCLSCVSGSAARQRPVQPGRAQVQGREQVAFLALLDHPVPAFQVGVGELELDGDLVRHGQIALFP